MRHLILVTVSFLLTACASVNPPLSEQSSGDVTSKPDSFNDVAESGSAFSIYLRDYLDKNINPRVRTSRSLIDRSNLESNGRLPSKSLFQSLGYRVRDSLVAMPPELSSRIYKSPEELLNAKLIQDVETVWALLDTTQARLNSSGGLEKGRQDWEVPITRRNLLLDAIGYWFQLRNQESFNKGVTRLSDTTDELFNQISKDREHFDVKDLREQELALLSLREDIALLFQYYSSEQARLFNRIDKFELPKGNNTQTINFTRPLRCEPEDRNKAQERQLLSLQFASSINKIFNSSNKKAMVYELNTLARNVSLKALKLHAQQLNEIESIYNADIQIAEQQREVSVNALLENNKAKVALGQEVDINEVEALKSAPLNVSRKQYVTSKELKYYKDSISVLAKWTAEQLVKLNQQRLETVIDNLTTIYHIHQESVWNSATDEAGLIRDLLYEVYDATLVDYLLAYERTVFLNKALFHECNVSNQVNSRNIEIEPQVFDQIAHFAENYYQKGLANESLKHQQNQFQVVSKALFANKLGRGYKKAKPIAKKKVVSKPIVQRNSFTVATKQEVMSFVEGQGFTIEVGQFRTLDDAVKMIKRFKVSVPKLIYSLSKNGEVFVYKVLVGTEKSLDSVSSMKTRIGFGAIKKFSEVRSEVNSYKNQVLPSKTLAPIENQKDISVIKAKLIQNNFKLSDKSEALELTQGLGYTVEVGQFDNVESTIKMLKRFNVNVPKLVYLSPRTSPSEPYLFKVLIGSEKKQSSAIAMQKRIGFGTVKEFSLVRSDINK